MRPSMIVKAKDDGENEMWVATTLDKLGKSEEYFEEVLAESPELLGLKSRRTGVHGPYKVFRQLSLVTPAGRTIFPDIVILSASGHVIIAELKKGSNQELYDRKVIAQIIDYASSFAALSKDQIIETFSPHTNETSWIQLIESFFSTEDSVEELASELLNRIQSGKLNLAIACDKIPPALPSIVAGIVNQSSLGFELDLIEVTPFVREEGESNEIIFVPTPRLSTEIVSTTEVIVTYKQGDQQPSTIVNVEPVDEIVEKAKKAKNPDLRTWTHEETDEAFQENGDAIALELLQFVKEHSPGGRYISDSQRVQASVGLYLQGKGGKRMLFTVYLNWKSTTIQLRSIKEFVSAQSLNELRSRINQLFNYQIGEKRSIIEIPFKDLEGKLEEFKNIMLWFKQQAEERLTEDQ